MTKKQFILKHLGQIILIMMGISWIFFDKMEPIVFLIATTIDLILLWVINSNVLNTIKNKSKLTYIKNEFDNYYLTDLELKNYYRELILSKTKSELIVLKNKIDNKYKLKSELSLNTSNENFNAFYKKLIISISNSTLILLLTYNVLVLLSPHRRKASDRYWKLLMLFLRNLIFETRNKYHLHKGMASANSGYMQAGKHLSSSLHMAISFVA